MDRVMTDEELAAIEGRLEASRAPTRRDREDLQKLIQEAKRARLAVAKAKELAKACGQFLLAMFDDLPPARRRKDRVAVSCHRAKTACKFSDALGDLNDEGA